MNIKELPTQYVIREIKTGLFYNNDEDDLSWKSFIQDAWFFASPAGVQEAFDNYCFRCYLEEVPEGEYEVVPVEIELHKPIPLSYKKG